jgi:hypothetical protein
MLELGSSETPWQRRYKRGLSREWALSGSFRSGTIPSNSSPMKRFGRHEWFAAPDMSFIGGAGVE